MGGVDVRRFKKPNISKKEWKQKYNLKNKVVLYVGRFIKEKGVQHLINISEHFPDTTFVITGSGDYKNVLLEMSKEHKNILILPHLDNEIVDFFVHSDILCVPSVWEEALGLVILEAMASKTVVVASNIGGIPSIVKHNKTGLLFDPGNEEDLKEKIAHVLYDKNLSTRLTANAYRMTKENFTWKKIAEKIDSIYCKSVK
ncbi:MAG: glycosyltransferase family 4 protein, partial [Petrotogales bacterium]